MVALNSFGDFVIATGEISLKGPQGLVNEDIRHGYMWSRYMDGKGNARMLQGGARIRFELMFDSKPTAEFYNPNQDRTYSNPQVVTKGAIDYRYLRDDMTWVEQELELNYGGGGSADQRFQEFVDMRHKLEMRVTTSTIETMEDALWRVPKPGEMEAQEGLYPYSIPSYVNEGADGVLATHDGKFDTLNGTAWSTVAGINQTNQARWKNQLVEYTQNDVDPTGAAGANLNDSANLMSTLDRMFHLTKFKSPKNSSTYFESTKMYGQHVACALEGMVQYKRILRASNDVLAMGKQDSGYNKPTIYGVEVEYIEALDTAALYRNGDGSALVTEEAGTAGGGTSADALFHGPRYYFLNTDHLFPVFYSKRYMHRKAPMNDIKQPESWAIPVVSWYNLPACSRQRIGLVRGNLS